MLGPLFRTQKHVQPALPLYWFVILITNASVWSCHSKSGDRDPPRCTASNIRGKRGQALQSRETSSQFNKILELLGGGVGVGGAPTGSVTLQL
jgi:hypothetical protein